MKRPATMPAWQVRELGEPEKVMVLGEVPVPEPGPGEALVDVAAAGLNFPDVLMARGEYQESPELPFTPGIEICGRVVDAGSDVPGELLDSRRIGVTRLPHGGLARYAVVPAAELLPAPPALDDAGAAVLHISYQTAWFALHRRAALRVGETLLVLAAAGGVGGAAVQLGRAAGARVIAVVGGPQKVSAAREAGADTVIDRTCDDVVAAVKEATGGRGADVVFDPVGGDSFDAATKAVAFEGRIVVIGFAGGRIATAATNHLLVKNYSVVGLHWGLYRRLNPDLVRRAGREIGELVEAGAVRPLVADRLDFVSAAAGLTRLAAGEVVGRIAVLGPDS